MMVRPSPQHPPAAFSTLLRALDPAEDGLGIQIGYDIRERLAGPDFAGLREVQVYVDGLLAEPDVANADLKGLLNRTLGAGWSAAFEFGADAKAARRYLEALSLTIAQETE